jgi:hypothetical protein
MKKIMHILFLSCLKATELIEKKLYFKLSMQEKLQLKLHKMMCDACTKYEKQSVILEKGIKMYQEKQQVETDMEQLKKQITANLNKTRN